MKTTITGGCACGAIRYESSGEPLAMLRCHCRDCQRTTGDGHASFMVFPAGSFRITSGTPHYHFTESLAMGLQKRGFCADCGSRLTGGENKDGTSPIVAIHPASLDDPSIFTSQMDVWVSDAQPWSSFDPNLPKFDKYPG